jgi:hypothetical protein
VGHHHIVIDASPLERQIQIVSSFASMAPPGPRVKNDQRLAHMLLPTVLTAQNTPPQRLYRM